LPSFTISTEKAQYGTANKRNEKEKNFFITGMRVSVFIGIFVFWKEVVEGRWKFKMTKPGVGDKSFGVV
jgi:hypothetical protein